MARQYTEEQIQEYMRHVRETAAGKYTPEQLAEYERHVRETAGPDALGLSPDKPAEQDLYGAIDRRVKAAFGDLKGAASQVLPGFKDVRRNARGELVAQGADGRWYKDADSLTKNPAQWFESALGQAPATAGMMLGGVAGTALGTTAGPAAPYAIPLAAAAGGGAGAAAGENLRQYIGNKLGVHDETDTSAIAKEAEAGALAEMGGQAGMEVAKRVWGAGGKALKAVAPRVAQALDTIHPANIAATTTSTLTGVDKDAVRRTLERPSQVRNPKGGQEVAKAAEAELLAADTAEGKAIQEARDAFHRDHGATDVDTSPLIQGLDKDLVRVQPNAAGEGQLTPAEIRALSDRQRKNLVRLTPEQPVTPVSPYRPEVAEPVATASDLLKYADGLDADIARHFDASALPGARTPRNVSMMEAERGRVKDRLHQMSSPYEAADQRFSQWAQDSKLLRGLESPATQQGTVEQLVKSPTKDNARDAAARRIPNAYEDILDMAADRAWSDTGPSLIKGAQFSGRDALKWGLVGSDLLNEGIGNERTNPYRGYGLAGAALLTPGAHRAAYRLGIPLLRESLPVYLRSKIRRYSPFALEGSQ